MRVVVVVACWLASATASAAPPRIEEAIAKAAAVGKPLVVELGATWCRPCREFENKVLPAAAVQQALLGIEFVRYDIDVAPGDAAASRYQVAGVPTFLTIDSDGRVLARVTGRLDVPQFTRFLASAGTHTASSRMLVAAVAARPTDPTARFALARHYRAVGKPGEAVEQIRAAIANPALSRPAFAELTAMMDDIVATEARIRGAVDSARAFVTTFPDSPLASERLAILIASGRVPATEITQLAHDHLAAVPPRDVPEAARVAVLAGIPADARLAVARVEDSLEARLLDIELDIDRDLAGAKTRFVESCARPPQGYELGCYALRRSVERGQAMRIERLRAFGRRYIDSLENPAHYRPTVELAVLGDGDRDFGNAVLRAIDRARELCEYRIIRSTRLWILVEAGALYGLPTSVDVKSRHENAALEQCVEAQVRLQPLPVMASPVSVVVTIDLAAPTAGAFTSRPAVADKPARRAEVDGLLVYGTARLGVIDSAGVGIAGAYDITRTGRLRVLLRGQFEAGGGDEATYDARGTAGLGYVSPTFTASLGIGYGASRFSETIPHASDIPIELRTRLSIHRLRVHGWLQLARILDSTANKTISRDGLEPSVGIAAGATVGGVGVFAGGAFERRNAGDSAMLLLGIALKGF